MVRRFVYLLVVAAACYLLNSVSATAYNTSQLYEYGQPNYLTAEESEIKTFPKHSPIYPSSTQEVTYSLDVESDYGIKSIYLYESVQDVDINGPIGSQNWSLVKCWNPNDAACSTVTSFPVSATSGPHPHNKYISYKFVVTDNVNPINRTRTHTVSYATRDYAPSTLPANDADKNPIPVYVQSSSYQSYDTVFIPDTGINSLDTFYNECEKMIYDGIFYDKSTINPNPDYDFKCWWVGFNFFINPLNALANDITLDEPINHLMITTVESWCILFNKNVDAWANLSVSPTRFSAHFGQVGTFLHEAGHALFSLYDEYKEPRDQNDPLPNIYFPTKPHTKNPDEVVNRQGRKPPPSVSQKSWKICKNNCTMNSPVGNSHKGFDNPCIQHVYWQIRNILGFVPPPPYNTPVPHNE